MTRASSNGTRFGSETRAGIGARGEVFDVARPDFAERLAETMKERHGGVDIVVGNAVVRIGPEDDERKFIDEYVEVNNFGTTRLLRAFAPIPRDGRKLPGRSR